MATAKKAAPPPRKKTVDANFLNTFTSTLDEVAQYANGYGELKSAVIESEDNGVKVIATWDGRGWSVEIG